MSTPMLTVGDLVAATIFTTSPATTLRDAAAELTGEYCGLLLVTGPAGLLGVVSERDITRAIGEGEDPDELRVEDVMTDQVVMIGGEASVHDALALMDADQIRHLVVTDESAPVGVVSLRDVARALMAATSAA